NKKFKNQYGSYFEMLFFYKIPKIEDLQLDTNYLFITEIEVNDYSESLKNFISQVLYDDFDNIPKSSNHCLKLFWLIDSIFIHEKTSIKRIDNGSDDYFIIESKNELYILQKSMGA